MRFLLLSPHKIGVRFFIESPPIGLGYLATAIRKLGHEVDIKDCVIEGWDNLRTIEYIKEYKPDIVGINVFSSALRSVKELIGMIKALPSAPMVILGGPHCSGVPEDVLLYFDQADYAFQGECEIAIGEFIEFLQGKRIEGDVTGLIWRQGNEIRINPYLQYAKIEEFGYPAWDLIDPRKYFKQVNIGPNCINLHMSRGCPFSCRFCVKLGNKVRLRSLEHIWGEIEYLDKTFGITRFIINDEGYTMLPKMVKDFCRLTISKGNKYTFFTATGMRLNRVDDEMLQLMKEARHDTFFGVGIESAVPRVRQELMRKQLTQEELLNGLEIFKRNGFTPAGNFIIGFPGETKQEMKQSINFACDMIDKKLLHGANIVCWLPLPGSEATRELQKSGELKDFDFTQISLSMVSYAPKGMTIKELDRIRRWGVWKVNSRPRMFKYYFSKIGVFKMAVVIFIRIFVPNFLLPKKWRRIK
jgi:anaerobic magnesium-protoporphyrin IX monomethyl ester cyclase